jgi:hypothetical protein
MRAVGHTGLIDARTHEIFRRRGGGELINRRLSFIHGDSLFGLRVHILCAEPNPQARLLTAPE